MAKSNRHKNMLLAVLLLAVSILAAVSGAASYASAADGSTGTESSVLDNQDTDGTYYQTYHDDIMLNADQSAFIFQSIDTIKTSKVSYKTLGFTVTRCNDDCNPDDKKSKKNLYNGGSDYIIFSLDDGNVSNSHENFSSTTVLNTWTIPVTTILTKIDEKYGTAPGGWYDDIKTRGVSNKQVYLKFDAVMCICLDGARQGFIVPNTTTLAAATRKTLYSNCIDTPAGCYPDDLAGAKNWKDKNAVYTHFDKYIALYPEYEDEDVPDIPSSSEVVTTIGKSTPVVKTYNTSKQYDLSQGIPSSEVITNGISVDGWYGTVQIAKHTGAFTYTFTYRGSYDETKSGTYPYYDDLKKKWTSKPYSYKITHTKYGSITKTVPYSYYYVGGMDLYTFQGATVENGAYNSGKIAYTGRGVQYQISIDGITNPASVSNWNWTEAKNKYHVTEGNVSTSAITGISGDSGSDITAKAEAIVKSRVVAPTVRNDQVTVNGYTYMDGSDTNLNNSSVIEYKTVGASDYGNESYTAKTTIPDDTANGLYSTTLQATYKQFGLKTDARKTTTEKGTDAILAAYQANEPVHVHTPVISAVSILDGEKQTQLINPSTEVDYQLQLDGTYTFKFDPAQHRDIQGYGWSGAPSKYDKYVKEKLVRYPFTVEVDGTYYDVDSSTGYTDWITANTDETTFYVPSWAQEGVYGVGGDKAPWNASSKMIQYRVEAINSSGESDDRSQDTANTDFPDKYVATYNIPVEVSGIVYGFQSVGINDEITFSGTGKSTMDAYPFARYKQEKKVGALNRLGETSLRYTLNSALTNNWLFANTLPFTSGKNNYCSTMGYLTRGHQIAFTLETIANLWSDQDKIEIVPTYRYMDKDGKITDKISLYYSKDGHSFVKYGSAEDKSMTKDINLYDYKFNGTIVEDETKYTAKKEEAWYEASHNGAVGGINRNKLLLQKTPCYNFSSINLPSSLKLFTGRYEKLARNLGRPTNDLEELSINADQYDRMRYSMQTWYGEYYVPQHLYVCDSSVSPDDLDEGVTTDSKIWKQDGYLILNFYIKTSNEGHDHLQYFAPGGGNTEKDEWKKEGAGDTAEIITNIQKMSGFNVPLKSGDVAIIKLSESYGDKWEVGDLITN